MPPSGLGSQVKDSRQAVDKRPPFAYHSPVNGLVGSSGRRQSLAAGLLLLILLLSLGLRFYRLGAQSLWNDEGTSVAVAQRSFATIARDAANDIHPPLYYWILSGWIRLCGIGEAAVRSLSALLGVVLVALTYLLGRFVAGCWTGLAAALLAAIHPFQIVYAQETRMYMLVSVLAAASMLTMLHLGQGSRWFAWGSLALLEAAGLYTHYSFVFVVAILNLWFGLWLLYRRHSHTRQPGQPFARRLAVRWLLSQVGAVLLYLPWLPTAIRQVSTWPSLEAMTRLSSALTETWSWLSYGPAFHAQTGMVPIATALVTTAAGLLHLTLVQDGRDSGNRQWSAGLLLLWLALPVLLMLSLGLYREAYLKFLLITTPALVTLLASGLLTPGFTAWRRIGQSHAAGLAVEDSIGTPPLAAGHIRLRPAKSKWGRVPGLALCAVRALQFAAALIILLTFGLSLHSYYADPAYARDDYRTIADYVEAIGRPGDAIVLNAPGQQEVFGYYYSGDLPVHPLPAERPLDEANTRSALSALIRAGGRVFAVLWATNESDPGRFVEGWLDSHAYKALDSWYGNVRLAVYAVPERSPSAPEHTLALTFSSLQTDDQLTLVGYSLLDSRLAAGDIAQISLFWTVEQTPKRRYKVFLHILDAGNHIIGQRDAEPGGGVNLTTLWRPGDLIVDNYGISIHPATPPGQYRVEVGAYDAETGERLVTRDGSGQIWLEPLEVERPANPVPSIALDMQYDLDKDLGELALLGYDLHKLGFSHSPDEPLMPGDIAALALFWQARQRPTGSWQLTLQLLGSDGMVVSEVQSEPTTGYSTAEWDTGDIWRGLYHLPIPGDLPAGLYHVQVRPLAPDGTDSSFELPKPLSVSR